MNQSKSKTAALASWAFYDWANSSFSAIIQTFVFATYFTKQVAENETIGTAQWGLTNGIAALIIAILAPVLGAIADHGRKKKTWLFVFSYGCISATALLWFVTPSPDQVPLALFLAGTGIVCSELAFVFYNAMLPFLASPKELGRWSGWGWGLGYVGGTASLVLALFAFLNGDRSWFALDGTPAANIRATFPLVSVWYALFSLPLFLLIPELYSQGKPLRRAIREGLHALRTTIQQVKQYREIVKFLLARLFYIDGLITLFAFGGVYAAAKFGMDEQEVLLFGIALNVSSGIGAFLFAWIDDRIGAKKLILVSICGLFVPMTILLFVKDPVLFWLLGLILGIFVGPVQSASRSLMARLSPKHLVNEMFGFFALSGKATAFLGPLLVGWVTYMTGSQTAGMSVILIFLGSGALLMTAVKETRT